MRPTADSKSFSSSSAKKSSRGKTPSPCSTFTNSVLTDQKTFSTLNRSPVFSASRRAARARPWAQRASSKSLTSTICGSVSSLTRRRRARLIQPVPAVRVSADSPVRDSACDSAAGEAGHWHAVWSQRLQAEWLQAFWRIAMSKPFVETVCWRDLADYEGHDLPHGGLCRNDMQPKLAFKELRNFKASLLAPGAEGAAQDGDEVNQ